MEIREEKVTELVNALASVVHSLDANDVEKLVALSTCIDAQTQILAYAYNIEEKSADEKFAFILGCIGVEKEGEECE